MASNAPLCTQGRNCCWVESKPCRWLDGDVCSLRRELGSWEAVHDDPRYKESPQPVWIENGIADCGDFTCADCLPRTMERD